jgi:hypothetical protein
MTLYIFGESTGHIRVVYHQELVLSLTTTVRFGRRKATRGNYFACANRINVFKKAISRSPYQTAGDTLDSNYLPDEHLLKRFPMFLQVG